MNALDRIILDQYRRVGSTHGDPSDVLREVQGEVLEVATPELTLGIIRDHSRSHPDKETRSSRAQMVAFNDARSVGRRALREVFTANGLAEVNVLVPRQGYVGGLLFDGNDVIVHGHSMDYGRLVNDDPIQAAFEPGFYPPMMWVKALWAAAHENRPYSARELSVAEYLAKLSLHLGANVTEYGDLVGATGFMPGERLRGKWNDPAIQAHIDLEETEAFRLSGLCDQAVVDPEILLRTGEFAARVLNLGGTLN